MDDLKKLSQDLVAIINNAVSNRTYGSIEIYFEDGKITQVTQRIIRKINHKSTIKINNQNRTTVNTKINGVVSETNIS